MGWCSLGSLLDEVKIALSRIEEIDRLALTHSDIPLLLYPPNASGLMAILAVFFAAASEKADLLAAWWVGCRLGSLPNEVTIALSRTEKSDRLVLTHSDRPLRPANASCLMAILAVPLPG